jgi:hypothetical protein
MTVNCDAIPCGLVKGTKVPKDPYAYTFQGRVEYDSGLQMEAGVMSKTFVPNYQHTWCHISEG